MKNIILKYWHVLVLLFFVFLPLVWFIGKGDVIINGVDTNFPLNPSLWLYRRFYTWNGLSNGGSDYSPSSAGIFFHLIQFIPYIVGLSLQNVEKFSLIFWFGLIVLNSYLFVGNFIKDNKFLKTLFVCLYSLNIYMFNSWENVKVANLSLVAAIPLLLHIFIRLKDGLISYYKAGILLIVVSLVLSGAGINPAYFITALISLFILGFVSVIVGEDYKKFTKSILFMIGVIVLVSSYWIVPTLSFILGSVSQSSSIGSIGFNNWVDSLSVNTSIINVLRLQGAWDWYVFDSVSKEPLYLPYTPNFFNKIPFILFSFVSPAIALISLCFVRKNNIKFYLYFLVMLILGVFLGSGSHEPTGTVFKWLVTYLPYFSLFRSPWYIFTPLLTLSLAGLVVLFFDSLESNKLMSVLSIFLLLGNIIYCYPLVTGRIFRPDKTNGFFVNFPKYIYETADDLTRLTKNRTISYPDDQLEKFDWGYVGVEPVINLFSNNEMVFSAINNTDSSFSRIVNYLYRSIKTGNYNSVANLSSKLNADLILEKNDQQTLSDKIEVSDNWKTFNHEKWLIHQINQDASKNNKIGLANNFYFGYGNSYDYTNQLSLLRPDEHLLMPNDSVIEDIRDLNSNSGKIVSAKNSQYENYLLPKFNMVDPSSVKFDFYIPEDGFYTPILEKHDVIITNGNTVLMSSGSELVKWTINSIDETSIKFNNIYLSAGDYSYTYKTAKNLVLSDDFANTPTGTDQNKYTDFHIPDLDYQNPYLVTFDYNWSYGNEPSVLVSQKNERTMLQTKKIDLARNYYLSNFGFYFTPVETKSVAYISFLNKGEGNLVDYKNLKIYKLFTNRLTFVKESVTQNIAADIEFTKKSPVSYSGIVKNIKNPQTLIFNDNYSNGWKIKVSDLNGNKIQNRVDHFSINLYANAWYVDTVNQDFKFEIYYDPQKYFNIGIIMSITSVICIIFAYAKNYKKY